MNKFTSVEKVPFWILTAYLIVWSICIIVIELFPAFDPTFTEYALNRLPDHPLFSMALAILLLYYKIKE